MISYWMLLINIIFYFMSFNNNLSRIFNGTNATNIKLINNSNISEFKNINLLNTKQNTTLYYNNESTIINEEIITEQYETSTLDTESTIVEATTESIQTTTIHSYLGEMDDEECGMRTNSLFTNFIVHGLEVQPYEWPWVVALYIQNKKGINFRCGGTLISRNIVITAAHCVHRKKVNKLYVYLSRYSTIYWGELDESVVNKVIEVIQHPLYESSKFYEGDIAMLVLKDKVTYERGIKPICLLGEEFHHRKNEELGTVVGWGRDEDYNLATSVPRKSNLTIATNKECISSNNNFKNILTNNTFCAGHNVTKGIGPCNGDSGGGFYVNVGKPGRPERWTLRGIVSRGLFLPYQDDCLGNKYYVFTDIKKYIPWIRDEFEQINQTSSINDISDKKIRIRKKKYITNLECKFEVTKFDDIFTKDIQQSEIIVPLYQKMIETPIEREEILKEKLKPEQNSSTTVDLIMKFLRRMKHTYNHTITNSSMYNIISKLPSKTNEKISAILNIEKSQGVNSLHDYRVSSVEIAKYLVESGADVNSKGDFGRSVLSTAAYQGHFEVVKWFIENYNIDIHYRNEREETVIDDAAHSKNVELIKYLINIGADANSISSEGFRALTRAIRQGNYNIVKCLVEYGNASVNYKNDHGVSPLHIAVWYGKFQILQYLIKEANADVNIKDNIGETPLHYAVNRASFKFIKYLVEEGKADKNAKTINGDTPLHRAAYMARIDVVIWMIEEGFDVRAINKDGDTVLTIAKRRLNSALVDYWKEDLTEVITWLEDNNIK